MWRPCTIAAAALALTAGLAEPVAAFQEMPVPPPSAPTAAQPAPPNFALGTRQADPEEGKSDSMEIFGYAVVPKLDFGLELLYGPEAQPVEREQGLTTLDVGGDVTVLGKIKRRF